MTDMAMNICLERVSTGVAASLMGIDGLIELFHCANVVSVLLCRNTF